MLGQCPACQGCFNPNKRPHSLVSTNDEQTDNPTSFYQDNLTYLESSSNVVSYTTIK